MSQIKPHPYTSSNGKDCDWCPLPENNRMAHIGLMDWDGDDGSHAWVQGIVMASIYKAKSQFENIVSVVPIMDGFGNYTNVCRITMESGNQYDVTTTKVVTPPQ